MPYEKGGGGSVVRCGLSSFAVTCMILTSDFWASWRGGIGICRDSHERGNEARRRKCYALICRRHYDIPCKSSTAVALRDAYRGWSL